MESLFDGQHGLAITAGAELMHKSVVMMLQRFDDFGVAAADAEDAFGNADRTQILQILAEKHPSLLQWVGPSLRVAHSAFWKDDMGIEHVFRCSRGLLQGDPLSSMLFCILQDGVLRQMESELRIVDPRARIFAYLDDVVILCAAQHLPAAYQRYADLMAACGIPIQVRKSEYWARSRIDTFTVPFVPRLRVMKLQAVPLMVVADTPLATGSWLQSASPELSTLVQRRQASLDRITALCSKGLPKQQAVALMRAITVSDAVWIMRTSGIPKDIAAQMDRALIAAVCAVVDLRCVSPEHIETI